MIRSEHNFTWCIGHRHGFYSVFIVRMANCVRGGIICDIAYRRDGTWSLVSLLTFMRLFIPSVQNHNRTLAYVWIWYLTEEEHLLQPHGLFVGLMSKMFGLFSQYLFIPGCGLIPFWALNAAVHFGSSFNNALDSCCVEWNCRMSSWHTL